MSHHTFKASWLLAACFLMQSSCESGPFVSSQHSWVWLPLCLLKMTIFTLPRMNLMLPASSCPSSRAQLC